MQSLPPTGPPLVHETEAAGLVTAVYADVRRRMPFVPALFKALATDPPTLEAAWLQARALLDDPGRADAEQRLRERARPAVEYRATAAVRAAIRPIAGELPAMLLVVTSLRLSLDGRLPVVPTPPGALPPGAVVEESAVPELRGEHPLYAEIRRVYGTAHVPTMYRSLAAQNLLEEAWTALGPSVAGADAAALETAAETEVLQLSPVAHFAAESAREVLAQFRTALPLNLVFATAAVGTTPRG
jgi:hypothetical protein